MAFHLSAGDYVVLSVSDNGVGVPTHLRSMIFEPFFTTREQGSGSGMGLAACRGIALNAGGTIQVQSEPGQGSTFSIFLPKRSAPDDTSKAHSTISVSIGGVERILFVDDEPAVRRIFAHALRDRGYDVVLAESAEAALSHLQTSTFALVISDIVMPGMGGIALAQKLRAEYPTTQVLLISGNVDGGDVGFPFVPKPITPDGLARRIRAVLDSK